MDALVISKTVIYVLGTIMIAVSIIGVVIKAKKSHDKREELLSKLPARDEWRARNGGID